MTNPTTNPAQTLGDFTTTRRLLPISAIGVFLGAVSTGLAFVLLRLIALFTNLFFYQRVSFAQTSPANHHLGALVVLVPVVGALIVGVLARFGSEKIRGHGIPEAIEAILLRGSRVEPRVAFFKPISAAVSIGSGGPFGAEGPIIMTGGAVGSMIAQLFHLTNAERKTLLVAGAAAGMSATFSTPIAATLLAVELLLFEWKPRSFVPVALAAATAAALRPLVLGQGPLFQIAAHPAGANAHVLAASLIVGLSTGAASWLLTRAVYAAEDGFLRLPIHWMWWPAIGGVLIGLGGLVAPRAMGVGYDVIQDLLTGNLVGKALLVLVIVKATIWAASLGSGTSGGVLAPLLIIGASVGALEAPLLPAHGVGFWALVGMGSILGGTMRSPFTGVVFAFELTDDVGVLLPLLFAVSVAHAFTVLVLKRSILTEKIARRGFHLSREYAIDPLEILFVHEVMKVDGIEATRDLSIVAYAEEPLRLVAERMAKTGRTEMPVVTRAAKEELVGWITLAHLLKARARHAEEEERRERHIRLGFFVPVWLRNMAKSITDE